MSHNIPPEWISQIEEKYHAVQFGVAGHNAMYKIAKARVDAKIAAGTFNRPHLRGATLEEQIQNSIGDNYVSLEAEAAFAILYGLPAALDVSKSGDGGYDFKTGPLHWDIKATRHAHGNLNVHNYGYLDHLSAKPFASTLALVSVTRPVDMSRPKKWNQDQWCTVAGWASVADAVKLATMIKVGADEMLVVQREKLSDPSKIKSIISSMEGAAT